MLIAIFSDIHSNREAFSVCLAHAEQQQAEHFVFLGDLVGYGADPGWVVDTVQRYVADGAVAVQGNHDEAVVQNDGSNMYAEAQQAVAWTYNKLNDDQRKFLANLPLMVEEENRLYVHASAELPEQWNYVVGPYQAAESMLATSSFVTFCGHVHVPALYRMAEDEHAIALDPIPRHEFSLEVANRWLVIAGSVGQPRDGNSAACYALFDDTRNILTYFRLPYDVSTTARKICDAGLPPFFATRLEMGF